CRAPDDRDDAGDQHAVLSRLSARGRVVSLRQGDLLHLSSGIREAEDPGALTRQGCDGITKFGRENAANAGSVGAWAGPALCTPVRAWIPKPPSTITKCCRSVRARNLKRSIAFTGCLRS